MNTAIDVLLRVEYVVYAEPASGGGNQLHKATGTSVGISGGVPVGFGLDHCANQGGVDAMAVGCFAHQFFDAIAIHVHGRMRASRERSFAGKGNIAVLWGSPG